MCSLVTMFLFPGLLTALTAGQSQASPGDLSPKIEKLLGSASTPADAVRIFGEPLRYCWGDKTFTRSQLPNVYIMIYPREFHIVIGNGHVAELRHYAPTGYLLDGKIGVGSTLEEVLEVVGKPRDTVTGQQIGWIDGVLYKDIDGQVGRHYYERKDRKVRFFFRGGKVSAMYQMVAGGVTGSLEVQPVNKVEPYDDIRFKDLSKLTIRPELIPTLTFGEATVWPVSVPKAGRYAPAFLTEAARNPGLGVRALHEQGVTGKGVNVAIIDQPLYQDHPEFAGKITAYHDVGCESESSMHGPAVTSLLVGETCGTAPGARVYYVAAPSWKKDAAYYARAMDWILEQNKALPAEQKIRVVSVSAAPSGSGSPFTENLSEWDRACARAEAAGILVLDCTEHQGVIGPCWYDPAVPEIPARCMAGFPGMQARTTSCILAPCSNRTSAEEYQKGRFAYAYWGRGGLSWSIPYAAGVLAMGWQVNANATAAQMRDWLQRSAVKTPSGARIINPAGLVAMARAAASRVGGKHSP